MIQYDPTVVQDYAERLYAQSKSILAAHFFIGLFMGLLLFSLISSVLIYDYDSIIISIGTLIGGVFGYGSGQQKSSELRLQAQLALCQVKIEENTTKK